ALDGNPYVEVSVAESGGRIGWQIPNPCLPTTDRSLLKLDEFSKWRWRLFRRNRDLSCHDGSHRLEQLRLSVLENALEKSVPLLGSFGLLARGSRTSGIDAVWHKRLAVRRPAFRTDWNSMTAGHDDYRITVR